MVKASAYECGYTYASQTFPEKSFRHLLYETAMTVKSKTTPDKPNGVNLTEDVHFIGVGLADGYPGHALVSWAFKLTGGGDVHINTHFSQLKAAVAKALPAGVNVGFIDLKDNGAGNKITATTFKNMVAAVSGSDLMARGTFSRVFPQSSGSSSISASGSVGAPIGEPLTELWYGFHIPVIYKLRTGTLPGRGSTLVSDPHLHALRRSSMLMRTRS